MEYGITKQIDTSFDEAVEKIRQALADEGFGILTEIDVRATLKKKLDVEYDNYLILGACNPPLAYRALQAEKQVGLLLPCNVIIYEDEGSTFVSAMKPTVAMSMVDNPGLVKIAEQAEQKLKRVIDSLK
jgi:uncharacterized protein (DUF302 family)